MGIAQPVEGGETARQLLTAKEVASITSCDEERLKGYVDADRVTPFRQSPQHRTVRYDLQQVEKALKEDAQKEARRRRAATRRETAVEPVEIKPKTAAAGPQQVPSLPKAVTPGGTKDRRLPRGAYVTGAGDAAVIFMTQAAAAAYLGVEVDDVLAAPYDVLPFTKTKIGRRQVHWYRDTDLDAYEASQV